MIVTLLRDREILFTNKFNKLVNTFNKKYNIEKYKKQCIGNHLYKGNYYDYSPLIRNGECRFCLGYIKKNDYDILKEILK